MTQTCEAVFENGVFRPLELPTALADGQRVRLIVEAGEPTDVLALAAWVYEGLSEAEIKEIERIALDRRDFFDGESF